jgi:uncharacterized protein YecE (DUF72 family)
MTEWVGTSGFSYKEWKGSFYPEDMSADGMLAYYADRLNSVEINNTFYRMPNRKTLAGWGERTPETFKFVLKASQKITHRKRLKEVGEELDYLIPTMGELATKLGPTLVQLPPNFKRDLERLRGFLDLLPHGFQAAFEFRNASWFDDETLALLRERGQALVASDTGDETLLAVEGTASFAYARLRQEEYSDAQLTEWAARLHALDVEDLYVFFKHEDGGTGPKLAARFLECLK